MSERFPAPTGQHSLSRSDAATHPVGGLSEGRNVAEAAAMLGGVLLMIFLGAVKGSGKFHLGDNRPAIFSCLFQSGDCPPSGGFLAGAGEENCRSVIVSDIESLTIERSGIVNLEEQLEQPRVRNDGWIKLQSHHLGVPGGMRTDLFIGGILCSTAGISDFC